MDAGFERLIRWSRRVAARFGVALLATGCAVTAPQGQTATERYDDPPARVGRISYVAGSVTLTDAQNGDRDAASLNWPLTSAQRLSSGPDGVAEVRVGSLALYLDVNSAVDFQRIDDELIQIVVQQGSVAVRARNGELLRELDITTPRERIVLDDVGRYRIDVDRVPGQTALSTAFGHARVVSGSSTFAVPAGQRGEIAETPYATFRLASAGNDGFDNWVAQRDRRDDQIYAERYVGPEMTGIESLDEYGSWRTVESYGTVWVPSSVPVGWAPYRFGRWSWIAPWGWTWIDDTPWGFAPFHYGRWAVAGGRWCWVPGVYTRRPVYAPALVAWYGTPGISISVTSGTPIGWFPLGPGEIYVPGYHVSRRYVNAINVQHVTNINRITTVNPPPRYINQIHPDAVTYAPPRALPGRMRIQEVAVRNPSLDVTRVTVQPRPPVEVDERMSKRRLLPAAAPVVVAPPAAVTPGVQQPVRPQPHDSPRRITESPTRNVEIPPSRPTASGQERGPSTFIGRPGMAQEAPAGRPDVVPPPKRALIPEHDATGTPRAIPPRPQPQTHVPVAPFPQATPHPQATPAPRAPSARPEHPRSEVPRPAPAPPAAAVPAPSQRAQPAPLVVRPAPPPAAPRNDDARGRGPVEREERTRAGEGPQRATPRDR